MQRDLKDQMQPAPELAPAPAKIEEQPEPKRGKPDGMPGTWDCIPDVDACPDITVWRAGK